jgi:hypothetical protein
MSIEPVGSGGDVICTVARGPAVEDQLQWRALYCPADGGPRVVVDGVVSRSFEVAASATERKVFLLVCGIKAPASYRYITPDRAVEGSLGVTGFQGSFSFRTKEGNPIAVLQGPAPRYGLVGNFAFDFATGKPIRLDIFTDAGIAGPAEPLISYDLVSRSKGNSDLGQSPLADIIAQRGPKVVGKGSVVVAQGVIIVTKEAASGLAVVYYTPDGSYLREMVKASPRLRDGLKREP